MYRIRVFSAPHVQTENGIGIGKLTATVKQNVSSVVPRLYDGMVVPLSNETSTAKTFVIPYEEYKPFFTGQATLPTVDGTSVKFGDEVDFEWFQRSDNGIILKSKMVYSTGITYRAKYVSSQYYTLTDNGDSATIRLTREVEADYALKTMSGIAFYNDSGTNYICNPFTANGNDFELHTPQLNGSSVTIPGNTITLTKSSGRTSRNTMSWSASILFSYANS